MKVKYSILFTALVILTACKKNNSPVGVNVLPGSDQLGAVYAEIYPKVSYSIFDDSVFTKNLSNANLLGSMNDAVFGRSDASIYADYEEIGRAHV